MLPVSTVAYTSLASAALTGTPPNQSMQLWIPQGAPGNGAENALISNSEFVTTISNCTLALSGGSMYVSAKQGVAIHGAKLGLSSTGFSLLCMNSSNGATTVGLSAQSAFSRLTVSGQEIRVSASSVTFNGSTVLPFSGGVVSGAVAAILSAGQYTTSNDVAAMIAASGGGGGGSLPDFIISSRINASRNSVGIFTSNFSDTVVLYKGGEEGGCGIILNPSNSGGIEVTNGNDTFDLIALLEYVRNLSAGTV